MFRVRPCLKKSNSKLKTAPVNKPAMVVLSLRGKAKKAEIQDGTISDLEIGFTEHSGMDHGITWQERLTQAGQSLS